MLIHVQLQLPAAQAQIKLLIISLLLELWHNSIFDYKFIQEQAENA